MDGWETILSFPFGARPIFRGELLVSGSVSIGYSLFVMINISPTYTSKIQFAAVDSVDSVFFFCLEILKVQCGGGNGYKRGGSMTRRHAKTSPQDAVFLAKQEAPSKAKDAS